jgi:hypothetical protein
MLSAKWLHSIMHDRDEQSLVFQAWTDFSQRCSSTLPHSHSPFFFPSQENEVTLSHNDHLLLHHRDPESLGKDETGAPISFDAFCDAYRRRSQERILRHAHLPIPPNDCSIMKVLHSLGVSRRHLRPLLLWMCNCPQYIGRECARCGERISKYHLELCAVSSRLPSVQPGRRIDKILPRAVTKMHAPSALRAVKIILREVCRSFPSLPKNVKMIVEEKGPLNGISE